MGIKLIIILIAAVFLTLVGITGGAFLEAILPGSEEVVGHFLCWLGGFLVNPVLDFGWIQLPIPQADDIIVALLISTPLVVFFYKNRERTWLRVFITWMVIVALVLVAYKGVGLVMVGMAEGQYGMSECLDTISIGGEEIIQYEWYSPLYVLGLLMAIIGVLGGAWKLRKWHKGE
jgi:hypothetical protein